MTTVKLNKSNIHQVIREYLTQIDTIEFPEIRGTNIEYMLSLKRGKIKNGPYPHVSIFEASNRILSDIVILFGIRQILLNPQVGSIYLPFTKYNAKLGNENGFDINTENEREKLIGEAFNVAPSFFTDKHRKMKAKLVKERYYDYRIIVFNDDAVQDANYYREISGKKLMYLPINWNSGINEINLFKQIRD